jgi:hypothetical protein
MSDADWMSVFGGTTEGFKLSFQSKVGFDRLVSEQD